MSPSPSPYSRGENVPKSWNISRFLDSLGREPHRSELRRIFDAMVERLGLAVPDLGKDTAGDSTALHARRKGDEAAKAEIAEGLPQPSGGKKEYLDDEGKVTKIVEWIARSTCGGFRRFHVPRRSSSGSTTAVRRSSESTPD